jgi:tRNA1Val (adenine37-N6)-methyltransferase
MDVTLDSIRNIKLYQSKTGYRFSVDALLLYDFVNLRKVSAIADLGAGSGIVGILLAKKYHEARITLFEIQDTLFRMAEKNIVLNNLQNRINVMQCDVREIPESYHAPCSYDLVVSNPPFRKVKSGRLNIAEERAIARHEIKLSLEKLIDAAAFLLRSKGRIAIIYHPARLSELMNMLKKREIEPKRLRFVHSHMLSEAKMVLLEAVKGGRTGLKVEKPLFIYEEDGSYTEEMEGIYGSPE